MRILLFNINLIFLDPALASVLRHYGGDIFLIVTMLQPVSLTLTDPSIPSLFSSYMVIRLVTLGR